MCDVLGMYAYHASDDSRQFCYIKPPNTLCFAWQSKHIPRVMRVLYAGNERLSYRKSDPCIVDEHIEASVLLLQVLSKASTALLIRNVELMEANVSDDTLLLKFFRDFLQSFQTKRFVSS